MLDGSGETKTLTSSGQPADDGVATDEVSVTVSTEAIPAGPPPIGYNACAIAAKALWNWIWFGHPGGPQTAVPPSPEEEAAARDLAQRLASGHATITLS